MKTTELPPDQHEITNILQWNKDHVGITRENPEVDLDKYLLSIKGEVENPIILSWKDIQKFQAIESESDFHCVEGWSVRNCKWYGVKFSSIAEVVNPREDAKYVLFKCMDGYTTSLELRDLLHDNVLLAYKLNGKPLERSLGSPLRLIVPHKYAYKSAMWISEINFMKTKVLGFWEKKGYSKTADVWKNDRYKQ